MNIKPLGDRILVLPDKAKDKTENGLFIPQSSQQKPLQGTIVVTGNGRRGDKMKTSQGDRVLYNRFAGIQVDYDGENYLIMREADVLAIL